MATEREVEGAEGAEGAEEAEEAEEAEGAEEDLTIKISLTKQ